MPKPTCSVDGCEKFAVGQSLCLTHYTRVRRHGSLLPVPCVCRGCGAEFPKPTQTGPRPHYCSEDCRPRKTHRPADGKCVGCKGALPPAQTGKGKRIKYCNLRCRGLMQTHATGRLETKECILCGELIDMTERLSTGRLKWPSYTKTCGRHKRPNRYSMTVKAIAERDGNLCKWCGEHVDLTIKYPHGMAPSVDHIIPWSKGGGNEPPNLQLLHLLCNTRKGTQLPV